MSYFDDQIEDLMQYLCDCENYHRCQWHERLKKGESRATVEADMLDELYVREVEWQEGAQSLGPIEE